MPIERLTVERLKRRADFLLVAGTRRKYVTPAFVLQARERDATPPSELDNGAVRIGFTATKKIGSSVQRNRARRRLREAARATLPTSATPGSDYVLVARGAALTHPYAAIVTDLRKALAALAPKGTS
jgi:ribonuclease P protein component